ncbi:MAG TPA: N-acetyl-gamma-glutamyl-phosphate reductase [Calditrichia bacterium]|nr:N-acetyl-gamma-glutamyl-phosphate reductase [Calditrichota bacterium]HQV31501.1 N-acetyl-gamma-glutamyl-phosphate reductase [Calditrichia bacterium]
MNPLRVGIVGGAGYTAGELLRLLIRHPRVEIAAVSSTTQAGKPVAEIHRDLLGETALRFSDSLPEDPDLVFLCLGHGQSRQFLQENPLPAETAVIDLSQDFRLRQPGNTYIYGLPEAFRGDIEGARRIANPGCFATAIQLALLPLATEGRLDSAVHISAITGSTGAGQSLSETTHFSWRNNNISLYKAFNHQHLGEIRQTLADLQPDFGQPLYFLPYRGNFSRGILATVYLPWEGNLQEAREIFGAYYEDEPFVYLAPFEPELKPVVNTNHCYLHLDFQQGQLLVTSAIDNLLKGASGQAVQNMNLMFGFEETAGLGLKSGAF